MSTQAIICGLALVVIGTYGYMQGMENAENDYKARMDAWEQAGKPDPAPVMKNVITALIPAAFGMLLIMCGAVVAIKPALRMHAMHLAAMIGVLGAIGGLVPLAIRGDFDLNKPSVRNGLLMTIVCIVFVVLCVQSFVEARKARKANPNPAA